MCHIRSKSVHIPDIHDKESFRKSMNLVDSMDQRVEHVTLAAESQEAQQWWIKAICMNKGMHKQIFILSLFSLHVHHTFVWYYLYIYTYIHIVGGGGYQGLINLFKLIWAN